VKKAMRVRDRATNDLCKNESWWSHLIGPFNFRPSNMVQVKLNKHFSNVHPRGLSRLDEVIKKAMRARDRTTNELCKNEFSWSYIIRPLR